MRPTRPLVRTSLALLVLSLSAGTAWAEDTRRDGGAPSPARPRYVGSSLFMLANLASLDYPPFFYQLNAGYEVAPGHVLSVEAITWRYYFPLGIPYGTDREAADKAYPGHIREFGIGLVYQRLLWRGLYSSLDTVPFLREYFDSHGTRIRNGFQLYMTARVGYHLQVVGGLFFEPSIAFNFWPVSTNVPDDFAAQDRKWPRYFLFEPGLHFGYAF